MRKLLLAIGLCICMVGVAHAQDPVAGAAAGIFPEAVPPPNEVSAAAGTIFQTIFTALDTPLEAASAGIVTNVANQTAIWVKAAAAVYLAIWAMSMAIPTSTATGFFLNGMVRELVYVAIAIAVIQVYGQFVVPLVLQTLPGELAALFQMGGTPAQGGMAGAFDAVMNQSTAMEAKIIAVLPDSWLPSVIVQFLKVELLYFISFVFVVWGFFIFVVFHTILVLLVSMGPLFIGMAPFSVTRAYARGWLSAVLAALGTIGMLALVMGLMVTIVTAATNSLGGMAVNVVIDNQISGYMGVVAALFILACSMTAIPAIIASIFGGAHSLMSPFSAGASAAGGYAKAGAKGVGKAMGL